MYWLSIAFVFTNFISGFPVVNKKVDVTPTKFESGLSDIQWLREDSSHVIVLTNKGRLWRSLNSGKNFVDISSSVDLGSSGGSSLNTTTSNFFEYLKVHPTNKNYAIALTNGPKHYITMNAGISWYPLGQSSAYIHNWIWHPLRPTHALYSEWTEGCRGRKPGPTSGDCNHRLFMTTNGGKSVEKIADFVIQYNWGDKNIPDHNDAIFLTQHTNARTHQPRWGGWHANVDFNKIMNRRKTTLVKGGNKFLISRNFVFVATVDDFLRQTVALMVSNDGGKTFKRANIPTKLTEKSYTILDTSEGSVLIHVNHGSNTPGILEGNVYVSDETGTRFSLSLANNIRAPSGECEFDRVQGVDGVYLANIRDELVPRDLTNMSRSMMMGESRGGGEDDPLLTAEAQSDMTANRMKAKKTSPVVRTVISYDKGGSWKYLTPPAVDTLQRPISCGGPDDPNGGDPNRCWLHLHGITHFDRYAPFYSSENALGLIMGTGNVGSHLSKDGGGSNHISGGGGGGSSSSGVNTYISRDAGRSWSEAHKGGYIYEFGDHGGLVVMANDNRRTDQVVFSWNEGRSWYDFTLGTDDVSVDNIIIEPTSTDLQFLLYGTIGDRGALYHLDFSTLGYPSCKGALNPDSPGSDYEYWSPTERGAAGGVVGAGVVSGAAGVGSGDAAGAVTSATLLPLSSEDGAGSDSCMLGRRVRYVRRKVDSECFNGRTFSRSKDKKTCQCTKDNFMCEVGFFRPVNGIDCEPSPYEDRDYMDVEGCTSSGVYYTHAWRKVPGDECTDGWQPVKVPVPCPPDSPMATQARWTLWTIVSVGFGIGFLSWASKNPYLRPYVQRTGLDQFVEVGYTVVGKAGESMQKGGEELFNFWTGTGRLEELSYGGPGAGGIGPGLSSGPQMELNIPRV